MSKMDQLREMRERSWAKASPKEKKRRALAAMAKPGVAGVNLMIREMERESGAKDAKARAGRPKGPDTVPLAMRIPPALLERLDREVARKNDATSWSVGTRVTRNGLVISILTEAMEKS